MSNVVYLEQREPKTSEEQVRRFWIERTAVLSVMSEHIPLHRRAIRWLLGQPTLGLDFDERVEARTQEIAENYDVDMTEATILDFNRTKE